MIFNNFCFSNFEFFYPPNIFLVKILFSTHGDIWYEAKKKYSFFIIYLDNEFAKLRAQLSYQMTTTNTTKNGKKSIQLMWSILAKEKVAITKGWRYSPGTFGATVIYTRTPCYLIVPKLPRFNFPCLKVYLKTQ